MPWHGHVWTIRPWLLHQLRPAAPPPSLPWSTRIVDPDVGPIRLVGQLSEDALSRAAPRGCVVVVHGLGGHGDTHYVLAAAAAAKAAGLACLRLNLRGAEADGQDFYNAGLTADLRAAIASPALARFQSIYVLGYSLGGHIALRYATEGESIDPRVRGAAAVCSPLDLAASAAAIDSPAAWVYRHHVLDGLKAMYAAVAARRRMPLSVAEARRIARLRAWDERVVAPRFGYAGASAYYAAASVGPRLGQLAVPSLYAGAEADPMVTAETVRPSLARAGAKLDVRWIEGGGHVGFPSTLTLGFGAPTGLEGQVMQWLLRHGD